MTTLTMFLGHLNQTIIGFHGGKCIKAVLNAENASIVEIVTVVTAENNCSKHAQNAEKNYRSKHKMTAVCPKCGSKALTFGMGMSTLMYSPPFTDEQGRFHNHDPNRHTQEYTCRKCGHKFSEGSYHKCWCEGASTE